MTQYLDEYLSIAFLTLLPYTHTHSSNTPPSLLFIKPIDEKSQYYGVYCFSFLATLQATLPLQPHQATSLSIITLSDIASSFTISCIQRPPKPHSIMGASLPSSSTSLNAVPHHTASQTTSPKYIFPPLPLCCFSIFRGHTASAAPYTSHTRPC